MNNGQSEYQVRMKDGWEWPLTTPGAAAYEDSALHPGRKWLRKRREDGSASEVQHPRNLLTTLVRCRPVAEYARRWFLRTAGCCSDGRETGDARYRTILRASKMIISALETGTHLRAMAASHPSLSILPMLFLLA